MLINNISKFGTQWKIFFKFGLRAKKNDHPWLCMPCTTKISINQLSQKLPYNMLMILTPRRQSDLPGIIIRINPLLRHTIFRSLSLSIPFFCWLTPLPFLCYLFSSTLSFSLSVFIFGSFFFLLYFTLFHFSYSVLINFYLFSSISFLLSVIFSISLRLFFTFLSIINISLARYSSFLLVISCMFLLLLLCFLYSYLKFLLPAVSTWFVQYCGPTSIILTPLTSLLYL